DEARWDFDYLPHTLAACIERNVERRYEVTTRPEEPEGRSYGILIRFSREGKAAYEFKGHAATPFVITGDRLIYSNHFPGASGAKCGGPNSRASGRSSTRPTATTWPSGWPMVGCSSTARNRWAGTSRSSTRRPARPSATGR